MEKEINRGVITSLKKIIKMLKRNGEYDELKRAVKKYKARIEKYKETC